MFVVKSRKISVFVGRQKSCCSTVLRRYATEDYAVVNKTLRKLPLKASMQFLTHFKHSQLLKNPPAEPQWLQTWSQTFLVAAQTPIWIAGKQIISNGFMESLPALSWTVDHLLQTDQALDQGKLGRHIHLLALENLLDGVAGSVERSTFLTDDLIGEQQVESLQGTL
jgi:hypothetical protein